MAYILMAYVVMAYVVMACVVCTYGLCSYSLCKGVNISNGHSGIWHLHYAHLAHYYTPQNTDCDP